VFKVARGISESRFVLMPPQEWREFSETDSIARSGNEGDFFESQWKWEDFPSDFSHK
jgi:hypothetical protein